MIALCIIVGIIVLFALILSIRVHVHFQYEEQLTAFVSWLFVKINILPLPEKDNKKKKKEEKNKDEKTDDSAEKTEKNKSKGVNPLKVLYENEKLDGIIEILKRLLEVINKFGKRLANSFVIDEMFFDISVSDEDAAQTAESYGKMCQKVFPVAGAVCSNCNVKKYSINVEPDYLGNGKNKYAFSVEISVNPRKLINAVLLFAFGAIFKVGIRLIKGIKPKTQPVNKNNNDNSSVKTEKTNNNESGAKQ